MLNLIKYLPKLQLATGQASKIISTSQKRNVACKTQNLKNLNQKFKKISN